jgi:predicted permease
MKMLNQLRSWLRAAAGRARLESEMEAEIRFHLQSYADDLMRQGVPPEEANRLARLEFGGMESHKHAMRDSLGLRLWDEFRGDLIYGLRMLKRSPVFTTVAILSLSLGIGANAIIFTFAKSVLLDRLAVPQASELRLLSWTEAKNGVVHFLWGDFGDTPDGGSTSTAFSYPIYQQLRRSNQSLQDLFAFKPINRMTATIDGQAETVTGELVSENYYQQLSVGTVLGRPIGPSDDGPAGSAPVAVISERFWARRFHRSPEVIGKTVALNLTPVTIIGVNPSGFSGATSVQVSPDVFVPLNMQPAIIPRAKGSLLINNNLWWVQIMGRLKPGVPEQTARAELDVALQQAVRATMPLNQNSDLPRLMVLDGSRGLNHAGKELSRPAGVLMTLTGFVLLLACANLANLLLARSAARQREISVRMALGAGRARILRQVFTESLLLSSLGGFAGLLLGYMGRNTIPRLAANSWQPAPAASSFDGYVLLFIVALSVLTALLFGAAPAFQATRTDVNSGLKDSAQTTTHRRKGLAGKSIVAFQIALSTLLVVIAGLFARTLMNLNAVYPGFQPKNVLLFTIEPPKQRYPTPKDIALLRQLEEKLSAIPGVESLTLSMEPLVANNVSNEGFTPDDQIQPPGTLNIANINRVGPRFFTTMAIPLLYGRNFGSQDTETSNAVAVINQTMAARFYPQSNPVGKTFSTDDVQHIEIIGVCADAKYSDLRKAIPPTFYTLYHQQKDGTGERGMTFEVRMRTGSAGIVPAIRRVVQSVDKDLPLIDVRTQVEQIEATMIQERIFATLTAGFGVLALVLACVGIYGIMAYMVSRRIHEFGIRLAVGAEGHHMLLMVLRESGGLAIAGIVTGITGALLLSGFLKSMLYGLKPMDVTTLLSSAVLLFMIALMAGWGPARRAAHIDPIQALRHE